MKKTIVALAVGAAALLVPAEAAHAAAPCLTGEVCGWTGTNFTGSAFISRGAPSNCISSTSGFNSVANSSTRTVRFYSGRACSGTFFDVPSGGSSPDTPFPVTSLRGV
jgi:hypothetical protein